MKIQYKDLSPKLGVEINNLDCSKKISKSNLSIIKKLIQEKHFICFKDQNLDEKKLSNFAKNFGSLEVYPEKDKTKKFKQIFNVSNVSPNGIKLNPNDQRVVLQKNNERWHTDSSYRYIPSYLSFLYGLEVLPPNARGGETEFSNMLFAYDNLSKKLKEKFASLHQVHSYNDIRRLEPSMPPLSLEERVSFPPVSHPLIRVHRDRDFKHSLFFTANTSQEISGMTLTKGRNLHKWLVKHVSNSKFCYKHRWKKNDLIVWDNRVLLHRVKSYDYKKYRRVLIRATVAGISPVLGPFSN